MLPNGYRDEIMIHSHIKKAKSLIGEYRVHWSGRWSFCKGDVVTVGIHSRAVYGGEGKCKCGYVDRWLILTI